MPIVEQIKRRSKWQAYRKLVPLGVPRSVFYVWEKRRSREDRVDKSCCVYEFLREERAVICAFSLQYSTIGDRNLT